MHHYFRFLLFLCIALPTLCSSEHLKISTEEAREIGLCIWQNECRRSIEGLTFWNEGEEFPSLGIGHFIWYPKDRRGPFVETFPDLIRFLESEGVLLPPWLCQEPLHCPWESRKHFLKQFHSERMKELRHLLLNTIELQTFFMIQRFEASFEILLQTLPHFERQRVHKQFHRVASAPKGFCALIDYVNFKGDGTSPTERYKGEGWGLLQVLQRMHGNAKGIEALEEFIESAKAILTRRVHNAPPERKEHRWLFGWKNRLDGYKKLSE